MDDDAGALPYDTYELEELKGENNAGMIIYKDTVTVKEDKTVVDLKDIENYGADIYTTARDKKTETNCSVPEESTAVIDKVYYNNLEESKKYMLVGRIMDRDTKEQLTGGDGEIGRASCRERVFSAV